MANDDYESPIHRKIVIRPLPTQLNKCNQEEAMQVIAELRRKHSNYLTSAIVDVLVPVCEDCAPYEGLSGVPDIVTTDWQADLLVFALPTKHLTRIKRIVKNNPHASVNCRSFCS